MAVLSFLLCFFFFFVWLGDEKCQTRLPPEPTHLRPWPLQPWRHLYNHCSASDRWGKRAFCLPPVCATLPTFYCSSGWFLFFFWMSFKHEAALGGKKVLHFQLSALGFESTGSNNVHPEQTSTCFLTQTTSWHGKKEVNTGNRSGKQKLHKGLLLNSCRFMGSELHFHEIWFLFFVWRNKFSKFRLKHTDTHTEKKDTFPIDVRARSNYSASRPSCTPLSSGLFLLQRCFLSKAEAKGAKEDICIKNLNS